MATNAEIIAKANEARSKYKGLFPIDPIQIARAYGLEVFTAFLPRDRSGQISYKERKIFIEAADHITRQTFSVAHELGHFLLHNDGTEHISKRDIISTLGIDKKEREANSFAAELLMPRDEILKLIGNDFKADSIAAYFGVSALALEYRLNNLGVKVYV